MLEKTSELVSAFVEATGLPASRVGNIARVLISSGWLPGARAARVPPVEPADHPLGPQHVAALMLAMSAERVLDAERVLVRLADLHTGDGPDTGALAIITELLLSDDLPPDADFVSLLPPYSVIVGGILADIAPNGKRVGGGVPDRALHVLQYPSAVVRRLRRIAQSTRGYHIASAIIEAEEAGSIQ
ncbi:hypothetical protein ACFFJ7_05350 [Pseudochelatococcus lubricantis]|uniref:hypothetical protein n=1 Tax=Pseudochelatococcus lubricantis TaxID=1538102 RepID=UPI0035E80E29